MADQTGPWTLEQLALFSPSLDGLAFSLDASVWTTATRWDGGMVGVTGAASATVPAGVAVKASPDAVAGGATVAVTAVLSQAVTSHGDGATTAALATPGLSMPSTAVVAGGLAAAAATANTAIVPSPAATAAATALFGSALFQAVTGQGAAAAAAIMVPDLSIPPAGLDSDGLSAVAAALGFLPGMVVAAGGMAAAAAAGHLAGEAWVGVPPPANVQWSLASAPSTSSWTHP